jgi:hypothetical protein
MRTIVCAVVGTILIACGPVTATDQTFEGTWHTTNRKLDGSMTCVVTDLGRDQWRARFFGTWQGVPFDYTVPFTGKLSDLRGTATIDGASYVWTGKIIDTMPPSFQATFGGTRYTGYFDLTAKGAAAGTK